MSGALDAVSLRAANMLVGNPQGTGALEIAYQGPTLAVEADSVRVAFAGGSAPIDIVSEQGAASSQRVPTVAERSFEQGPDFAHRRAFRQRGRHILRSKAASTSRRCWGANRPMRGPASADCTVARCAKATSCHCATRTRKTAQECMLPSLDLAAPRRFRVVLGPQDDYFTDDGKRTLLESVYTVTPASDRMGMRLAGPLLEHAKGFNIVSDGIAPGSIQVPGNGLPIVLLADRQTTGGYPKIATVISADMPALGRLTPGAKVAFAAVDIAAAEAAHRQLHADIDAIARSIVPVRAATIDATKLLESNLVSGMIDAHDWRPERA